MGCKPSKGASATTGSATQSQSQSNTLGVPSSTAGSDVVGSPSSSVRKGLLLPRPGHSPKQNRAEESANAKVYRVLFQAQQHQPATATATTSSPGKPPSPGRGGEQSNINKNDVALDRTIAACTAKQAAYVNPTTGATPLHVACRLLDVPNRAASVQSILETLLRLHPEAVTTKDKNGHIPLHYAIASNRTTTASPATLESSHWQARSAAVSLLLMADLQTSKDYLSQSNVMFGSFSQGCSPLYRAIQALPDDFDPAGPTVEFMSIVRDASSENVVGVGNACDGDKPLALLYRRFTRQFDLAEKFFAGDNSRPSVVDHRFRYKTAAGNTWRIIELLLRPEYPNKTSRGTNSNMWRIVHRAVQVETPPDLLRYIVETNAEDLTVPDEQGNLPLHYAAKSKPAVLLLQNEKTSDAQKQQQLAKTRFPAFYTKYVVDELLYKFPEAANIPDAEGLFPLTLAVQAGKHWIGGGIKSLYDAFPQALQQINLSEHASLQRALSLEDLHEPQQELEDLLATSEEEDDDDDDEDDSEDVFCDIAMLAKEEKVEDNDNKKKTKNKNKKRSSRKNCVIRDEQHDAIMLVQQPNVDVSEVVTSMWAHEEDAGVQMLGCIAITKLVLAALRNNLNSSSPKNYSSKNNPEVLRIALSAVAGVVNAMKAHPNEVIVQEKACRALKVMAPTDGLREVSFVASGAVSAIVGAMQAHVSDPGVQEEACGAVAEIIHYGGADRATIVASVSGLTAIVNAIAAHPHVVGVQRQGCAALLELTEYSLVANLPELPRSQTEPLLEAAKEKFPAECGAAVDVVLSRLT